LFRISIGPAAAPKPESGKDKMRRVADSFEHEDDDGAQNISQIGDI